MADIYFKGKNPGEEVLFVVRSHPFVFLRTGLGIVGLLIALVVIFAFFGASGVSAWATFIIVPITLAVGFREWFIWSNSTYILTNERLIAVSQSGFFSRDLSEVVVRNILTVNHSVKGPFQTFLNFGNVNIKVSGTSEDEILLRAVADPYSLQQKILTASGKSH